MSRPDPLLSFVLYSHKVEQEELRHLLAAQLPDAQVTVEESGVLTVEADGISVFVTVMPDPVPENEAADNAHPLLCADKQAVVDHQSTAMVSTMALEDTQLPDDPQHARLMLLLAHSLVARTLLGHEKAAGYYNGNAGTTFDTEFALRHLRSDSEEAHPPLVWAPAWVWQDEQGASGYTFGLSWFNRPEMQVQGSQRDPMEVFSLLMDLASAAVMGQAPSPGQRLELPDGTTLSTRAAEWIVDARRQALEVQY